MALSRRRFLVLTAAAACVGCSGGDDDGSDDDGPQGFGGRQAIGSPDDVRDAIAAGSGATYVAEARSWVVPTAGDDGFLALYQRCPHLGCRVPWCATSKRFECPCHLAVFDRIGEVVEGPANRGLDRFPIEVDDDGQLVIDTSQVLEGPPAGELTVDGEPAGPVCIAPPQ